LHTKNIKPLKKLPAKMAAPTPPSKEELSKSLVQEISEKGDEIPEKFILKDGFPEAIDAPDELWTHTLLMDFSLLSSSDPHELAKLKSALSNWGCFQVRTVAHAGFSPS